MDNSINKRKKNEKENSESIKIVIFKLVTVSSSQFSRIIYKRNKIIYWLRNKRDQTTKILNLASGEKLPNPTFMGVFIVKNKSDCSRNKKKKPIKKERPDKIVRNGLP